MSMKNNLICVGLRLDVAAMKESLDNGEISKLIRVESKGMIADFLTKTKKDGHRGPYWNY